MTAIIIICAILQSSSSTFDENLTLYQTGQITLSSLLSYVTTVDDGIELCLWGHYDESILALNGLLDDENLSLDEQIRAYHRLGTAYYGLDELSKTEVAFGEVLRLDPYFDLGPFENPALQEVLDGVRDSKMTSILIEGYPEYSLVFHNDEYIGTTPLQKDNLFIGDIYSFIVCAGGYDPVELVVTIQPDTIQTVDFSLSLMSPIEIATETLAEVDIPSEQEDALDEEIQIAELEQDIPAQEDLQITQGDIETREISLVEVMQTPEDILAQEDVQVAQDVQTPEDIPAQEDVQVTQGDIETQEVSLAEVMQTPEDILAQEDIQVTQDVQTPEDIPAQEDVQVTQGDIETQEVSLAEVMQTPEDILAQEDIQVTQDVQTPEDIPVPEDVRIAQEVQAPEDIPTQISEETSAAQDVPDCSAISESMALLLGDNVTMTSLDNVSLQLQSSDDTGVQNIQVERDYNQFRGTVTPIEIGLDSQNTMSFSEITFETPSNIATSNGVFSSRTSEEIMQVLSSKVSTVTYIYNKHIRNDPLLSGTLLVEITVETSGRISKVHILESSTYNPAFDLELADAIEKWRFGVVDENEDPLVIQYPFIFSR